MAAVEKLDYTVTNEIPKKKIKKPVIDYVGIILGALNVLRPDLKAEREYKFLHDRRFRFDIVFKEYRLAVEFDGGTFSRGRHTRGVGYQNDCKKNNLAMRHEWKVQHYSTADTTTLNWEFTVAQAIIDVVNIIKERAN